MMKKLFLAVVDLHVSEYMADSREETVTTLVWADDRDEAEKLIKEEYESEHPYSSAKWVMNMKITEALGTPI